MKTLFHKLALVLLALLLPQSAGAQTFETVFAENSGLNPMGNLIKGSDGNFYGTTEGGGASGYGTVFRVTPTGTLTTLHSFDGTTAFNPNGTPAFGSDGKLYGTADSLVVWRIANPTLSPLGSWKLTHLGDANAPDLGDPDGDGLLTLAEYGMVSAPADYAEGRRLRILLPRDPAHNDVTVVVESTDSLAGPWSPLATSTLGAPFTGPGYVRGDAATPGVKTVEIRDTVNAADTAGRFMRVRIVRP